MEKYEPIKFLPTNSHNYRSRSRTPPNDKKIDRAFSPFNLSNHIFPISRAPWVRSTTLSYEDPVLKLHEEIIDFFDFMQPTDREKSAREDLIRRLRIISSSLWPSSKLFVFGSYETGLWLPNSDVDIVIITDPSDCNIDLINTLADRLSFSGTVSEMDPITSATVPILKFKDKTTEIYVDICFNTDNGVSGSGLVKEYLAKYPESKYIICIIKYFLKQRGLNDTYSGGIGSFLLFCMVIASIQQHPSRKEKMSEIWRYTLSHFLVHFLKFFGEDLDIGSCALSIKENGSVFKKNEKNWIDRNALAVECPQNSGVDLARCSFNFENVRSAFKHVYLLLVTQNKIVGPTPLSLLIRFDDTIKSRSRVINRSLNKY